MQLTQNPEITAYLVLFLVLGFISIRINSLKSNFTKDQLEVYKKKFKLIRNTTLVGIILFLLMGILGCFLKFSGFKTPFRDTAAFFFIIGTLCVTVTSAIHYGIILSIRKKN